MNIIERWQRVDCCARDSIIKALEHSSEIQAKDFSASKSVRVTEENRSKADGLSIAAELLRQAAGFEVTVTETVIHRGKTGTAP